MRWTLALLTFCGALLWAQQPEQAAAEAGDRLAAFESRLELVEKALIQDTRTGTSPATVALESRLSRIESRLDQLERFAARGASVGGGNTRMLESRVRALEREVSRLRRF